MRIVKFVLVRSIQPKPLAAVEPRDNDTPRWASDAWIRLVIGSMIG